jgi:hypothetical protein
MYSIANLVLFIPHSFLMGCYQKNIEEVQQTDIQQEPKPTPQNTVQTPPPKIRLQNYPFVQQSDNKEEFLTLEYHKPTPSGYSRIDIEQNSSNKDFSQWLRQIPVESRQSVLSYKGRVLHQQADGIIPISVGNRDVQQCADSILRIYGEFLWYHNKTTDWGIHFTSGDLSTWQDWSEGERFRIGKKVERYNNNVKDKSYEQYQKWMTHAFLYAGTLSLHKDAIKVPIDDDIQPGDFFLTGGSPGHVVMILDVATKDGSPPIGIVAQGFMPAQEFHIIKGNGRHVIDNWFALPTTEEQALTIPNWKPFFRKDLYRFPSLSEE